MRYAQKLIPLVLSGLPNVLYTYHRMIPETVKNNFFIIQRRTHYRKEKEHTANTQHATHHTEQKNKGVQFSIHIAKYPRSKN
jgi:hypothetical protein